MVSKETAVKWAPWAIAALAVAWLVLSAVSVRTWTQDTSPNLQKEEAMIRRIDSLAGAFGEMMKDANESRDRSVKWQMEAMKLMNKTRETYENDSHAVVDSAGFDSLVQMFFADPYGVAPEWRADTDSTADR